MKRPYKTYTDNDILRIVPTVTSIAGLLKVLGLRPVGGNYYTMKRTLSRIGADTSHWKGHAWNKGVFMKDWQDYKKPNSLKTLLISKRGYRCEVCGISDWLGKPLTLELDHIDGNRTNNAEENLRLLCPNCHAQTPTWRNRAR